MDMRVMQQVLSPGMENTQEADLSAEMPGSAATSSSVSAAGAEQKIVKKLSCSAGQARIGRAAA